MITPPPTLAGIAAIAMMLEQAMDSLKHTEDFKDNVKHSNLSKPPKQIFYNFYENIHRNKLVVDYEK